MMRKRRLDNPNTSKDFPSIHRIVSVVNCMHFRHSIISAIIKCQAMGGSGGGGGGARHGSSLYMMYGLEMWHDHHPFTVSSAQFTGPYS